MGGVILTPPMPEGRELVLAQIKRGLEQFHRRRESRQQASRQSTHQIAVRRDQGRESVALHRCKHAALASKHCKLFVNHAGESTAFSGNNEMIERAVRVEIERFNSSRMPTTLRHYESLFQNDATDPIRMRQGL